MELREWNTKRTDQFILETCAIQVSGELPGSAEPIVVITIFKTSGVRTFLAVFLTGHLGNNGSWHLFKNQIKNTLKSGKDNPGVYLPPPLIYVIIFLLSILIQNYLPLSKEFFVGSWNTYFAAIFIAFGAMFVLPALFIFLKTRNTLITIKPATSLQVKGVYNISRNPMYVGLLFLYIGIAIIKGNWWTFILIPVVIFVVTRFVIIKEESYLERAFGEAYLNYKMKVGRWL